MILPALMIALAMPAGQQASGGKPSAAPSAAEWLFADRMRRADAAVAARLPSVLAEAPERGVMPPRSLFMPLLSELYPPAALRAEQQGLVLLRCRLTARATLEGCRLAQSSGVPSLDSVSFEVARLARYSPRVVNRVAEASEVTLPVRWVVRE